MGPISKKEEDNVKQYLLLFGAIASCGTIVCVQPANGRWKACICPMVSYCVYENGKQ